MFADENKKFLEKKLFRSNSGKGYEYEQDIKPSAVVAVGYHI
jgi:hypothetical protein